MRQVLGNLPKKRASTFGTPRRYCAIQKQVELKSLKKQERDVRGPQP